jgi:hypothetical protein
MIRNIFLRGLPVAAVCVLLLSGCPFTAALPGGTSSPVEVQHLTTTGSFTYTVDPGGAAKDVYFVFTNPNLTVDASQAPTVSAAAITVDGVAVQAPAATPLPAFNSNPRTLGSRIVEFNRKPIAHASPTRPSRPSAAAVSGMNPADDTENVTTGTFYTDIANYSPYAGTTSVNATCRRVVHATLKDGTTRSLSIWVGDLYWASDLGSDPARLDALATRFLNATNSDDIYLWETDILGEPWGTTSFTNLIPWDSKKTITILLTELNSTYPAASYIVGYFWEKDNYTISDVAGSNQRVMFYLDSRLYGNMLESGESSWAVTNYWPKIVISTLAHEFQHMIHYYQKAIVKGGSASADTWINEMCSMIMEDLVAGKLGVEGPRGVSPTDATAGSSGNSGGRIPYFNAYSNAPLAVTSGYDVYDYSTSYAFGAWLARNYGGTELLRRVVQCKETDSTAVVNAVAEASGKTESMQRLLEKWAAAVLLSDTTTAPAGYRYNTGDWTTSTANGLTYSLGSINVFNYTPTPTLFTPDAPSSTKPYYSSNVYYLARSKLAAAKSFSITIPKGVVMSVVLR